eukprot:TRINITY_DN15238_c0_g1_i2.p1 TRINITY_DN15238_c0_g1~~TRINITY_DN15238_c0_g1_i2.p1  ORF type:complete len:199 (+),score=62.20 TRINITY_DN15238_c0_g1_i2:238-834(+)
MRDNEYVDPFLHPETPYISTKRGKVKEEGDGRAASINYPPYSFTESTSSSNRSSYQVLFSRFDNLNQNQGLEPQYPHPNQNALMQQMENISTPSFSLYKEPKSKGRKEEKREENSDESEEEEPKKTRYVWSQELHESFLRAMQSLGDRATAKGVMTIMKEEGADMSTLTRIRVANHIQTYRTKRNKTILSELMKGTKK